MSSGNHAPTRAIIADDEDLGRLLLAEAATEAGMSVESFNNGTAALDAARKPGVGLILLDVDMPGLDGLTVCRRLREDTQLQNVPIVMVTGHDDSTAINQAFEAGATDFITKPVNWALLPHRLAYAIRNAASARRLADRETKVQALLDAVPDALWVFSYDGQIRWNPNTRGNPGGGIGETGIMTKQMSIAPPDRMPEVLSAVRQMGREGKAPRIEYRDLNNNGEMRSYELRFSRCQPDGVLVVRQDTTERTRAAEHIEKLAYFDALTALPNRQQCIETAQRMINVADKRSNVAVVYMDLNSFKRINDSFGHSVGDTVLKTVATKLRDALSAVESLDTNILLARFGGDEFIVLVSSPKARQLALQVAEMCTQALRDPITINRLEFFSTPSIGIAVYPEDGDDLEKLLKNADTAMYHAKSSGTPGPAVYTPAMGSRVRDWLEMESRLRRAVRDDRLYLEYQPKFWLRDNRVAGAEALVRWFDEEHGEVSPSRFVSMAEESGLIIEIGAWVARAACKQVRHWLDRGISVPVAINVSGKELLHGDPIAVIEAAIAEFKVPPELLEIEITESVVVRESAAVRQGLEKLRRHGCKVALDDFGTGYSSLAYITRFPLDRIKIDRAFVREVDRSTGDAAIASAILSLAQSLGLEVTAEGIERPSQLEWLRSRGCHQVQGYLLSRPMSAILLEKKFLTADTPASDSELPQTANA